MSSLTLIVAATLTNGIGQSSRLPWRLPREMAYFARVTTTAPEGTANAVIMGRNTWESIPPKFRPLKGRLNIVVSSNPEYLKGSSDVQTSETQTASTSISAHTNIQDAISHGSSHKENIATPAEHRCFIIGGASIYKAALEPATASDSLAAASITDRILMTRILSPAFEDCDVFFPEFRDLKGKDGAFLWSQASHEELEAWVGSEVPRGTQKEKGVEYEFQMWTLKR
ncbi:hypothetical protein EW145_g788 [Phellinidium pouzarii]|uniref:Dihydrofolate reductase n=1 Tax=Phellinidium pouzarii TaxID=167371 RepID=A0A4S4LHJ2_9AGAM|nr:hypothetical protein EW145_g788 [Phellinidium pouzarii]